jgi:hypothetical protein
MTCQPAVEVGLFLTMAIQAESHLKSYPFNSVLGFNSAMALLTANVFFDVPLVVE